MQETFISNNFLEEWEETWWWCLRLQKEFKVEFMFLLTIILDCQLIISILKWFLMVNNLLLSIKVLMVGAMHLNTTRFIQICSLTRWTLGTRIRIFRTIQAIKEWFRHTDKPSKGLHRDPLARIYPLPKANIHSSNSSSSTLRCSLRLLLNSNTIKTIKANSAHKDLLHFSIIHRWYLADLCRMDSPIMGSQERITNLDSNQGIQLNHQDW